MEDEKDLTHCCWLSRWGKETELGVPQFLEAGSGPQMTALCEVLMTVLQGCLCLFSCPNKIPSTEWHIYTRHSFPTVLEAGGPRSRCRQIGCLVRTPPGS